MRFLMNTLLPLNSTAVPSCVSTKLYLDALALCRCFRVVCEAWLPPITALGLLGPVQSCISNPLLRQYTHRKSLPAVACTPLLAVLFPYA